MLYIATSLCLSGLVNNKNSRVIIIEEDHNYYGITEMSLTSKHPVENTKVQQFLWSLQDLFE